MLSHVAVSLANKMNIIVSIAKVQMTILTFRNICKMSVSLHNYFKKGILLTRKPLMCIIY